MRKLLISIATAASALAIAAPASAQFYGAPSYGYDNYGYGNSYDYRGGGAYESRRLVALNRERMARIHAEIDTYARRGMLDPREAARLHQRASAFDRELSALARRGMSGREGAIFDARVDRLSEEVRARVGYGYGNRYGNGYGYDDDGYRRW